MAPKRDDVTPPAEQRSFDPKFPVPQQITAAAQLGYSTARRAPSHYRKRKEELVLCLIELRILAHNRGARMIYSECIRRDSTATGLGQLGDCARARRSASVLTLVSDRKSDVTMRWASDASTKARILRSPAATNVSTRSARSVRYTAAR